MKRLIEVRDLTKSFGGKSAVEGLNFHVDSGEIYGLVGPDGAGKTTTMRLLCSALEITSGEAKVVGFSVAERPERAREQIGYLAQRFSLYDDLTVMENLRFFAEVRGMPRQLWQPRCLEILSFVGLAEFTNRRAAQLSGGMKQKLGLAAALVHHPPVLLLDEPTTGVDPVTRQDFWQLVIRLTAVEDVAVLVSTPYMDEAVRCSRLGFLRDGKLLVEGTPAALRSRLDGQIVELKGRPLRLLRQVARADVDVEEAQLFGDRVHLRVSPGASEAIIQRLRREIPRAGGDLQEIGPVQPQLEDLFLALQATDGNG